MLTLSWEPDMLRGSNRYRDVNYVLFLFVSFLNLNQCFACVSLITFYFLVLHVLICVFILRPLPLDFKHVQDRHLVLFIHHWPKCLIKNTQGKFLY